MRERRDFDENELLRRRQELEDIIIDLTERIRIAKLEVYEVKAERDEIDGDKELRQKLREEELSPLAVRVCLDPENVSKPTPVSL